MNCECGVAATIHTHAGISFAKCGRGGVCAFSQCLKGQIPRSIPLPGNPSFPGVYENSGSSAEGRSHQSQQVPQQSYRQNRPPLFVTIELRKFDGLMPWFGCRFKYDEELTAYFRTIQSDNCRYASSAGEWQFNLLAYGTVVSHLKLPAFVDHLKVDMPPEFLMRKDAIWKWYYDNDQRKKDLDASGGVVLNLNSILEDKLLDYQTEGIEYVVSRGGRAFIADDMGLGKTIQAIGVLLHYRQHWPALVIMPPGLKDNWKKEILENAGDLIKETHITVVTDGRSAVTRPGSKVTLLPYSLLPALVNSNKISTSTFGIVIADESQKLKNREAAITKSALPILKNAKVALCLSGTPSPNQPVELFTQLSALLPAIFRGYDDFVTRYCDGGRMQYVGKGRQVQKLGATRTEELHALMMGLVMIRRQKSVVLKDNLPEKKREFVLLDLPESSMAKLNDIKKEKEAAVRKMHSASDRDKEYFITEVQLLTNKLVQQTGIEKAPAFLEHLQKIIEEQIDARRILEEEADREHASKHQTGYEDVLGATNIDVQEMTDTFLVKTEKNRTFRTITAAPSSASSSTEKRPGSDTESRAGRGNAQMDILQSYEGFEGAQEDWRDLSLISSQDQVNPPETSSSAKKTRIKLSCIEDDGIVFLGTSPPTKDVAEIAGKTQQTKNPTASTSMMMHVKCTSECHQPCLMHCGDEDLDSTVSADGSAQLSSESEEDGTAAKRRKLDDSSDSDSDGCKLFRPSKANIGRAGAINRQTTSGMRGSSAGKGKASGKASMASLKKAKQPRSGQRNGSTSDGRRVTSLVNSDSDSDNDEAWSRIKQKNLKALERRMESKGPGAKGTRQTTLTGQMLPGDEEDEFSDDQARTVAKGNKRKKRVAGGRNKDKADGAEEKDSAKSLKKAIPSYKLASKPHHRKLGRKIIVFGHHQDVLNQIEAFLNMQDVGYVRVDGSTPAASRDALVHTFQEDDKTLVALLSITAAGTGYTFTRANIALFPEVQWSWGNVEQAEDRIYRLGQKAKVVRCIYYFVPGSGDDSMQNALQKKESMVGDTVGHSRAVMAGSSISSSSSSSSASDGGKSVRSPQRQTTMTGFVSQSAPSAAPLYSSGSSSSSSGAIGGPSGGLHTSVHTPATLKVIDSDSFQYSDGGDCDVVIVGVKKAAAPSVPALPKPVPPRVASAASVYGGSSGFVGRSLPAPPAPAPAPASFGAPQPSIMHRPTTGPANGAPLHQRRVSGAAGPVVTSDPQKPHPLSPATKARIEANKQRALRIKAEREAAVAASTSGKGQVAAVPVHTRLQVGVQNYQNPLVSGSGKAVVLSDSGVAKAEEWLQRR